MVDAKPLAGHHAHHDALRLWLRLFTCSQLIERAIRVRLPGGDDR